MHGNTAIATRARCAGLRVTLRKLSSTGANLRPKPREVFLGALGRGSARFRERSIRCSLRERLCRRIRDLVGLDGRCLQRRGRCLRLHLTRCRRGRRSCRARTTEEQRSDDSERRQTHEFHYSDFSAVQVKFDALHIICTARSPTRPLDRPRIRGLSHTCPSRISARFLKFAGRLTRHTCARVRRHRRTRVSRA